MSIDRPFPISQDEVLNLLGYEAYLKEKQAISPFCCTAQDVDPLLFLYYQRSQRWNAGFHPLQKWDIRNLNSIEKALLAALLKDCDPKAVESVLSDKKAINTLFRVHVFAQMTALFQRDFLYVKKTRGALTPSYACMYNVNQAGIEIILVLNRIYKGPSKKVYQAIHMKRGDHLAITMWPHNTTNLREVRLPYYLQMHSSNFLMPPYEKILQVGKLKGGIKLIAVGELYESNCLEKGMFFTSKIQAFLAALKGVQYMHELGWAHCDIKPDNIFVTFKHSFVLADYGYSCPLKQLNAAGTNYYAAPETFSFGAATEASDVWQIGVTGLALLGYPVNDDALLEAKRTGPLSDEFIGERVRSWKAIRAARLKKIKVSKDHQTFFDVCVSCLKVNPSDRPSISTLIKQVEPLLNSD
jgi:hypothetical protein